MGTFLLIILTLGLLALIYLFYQQKRNEAVFNIRMNWIDTEDPRYKKYSYVEMYLPSRKNWFGLTMPRDKDFK